MVLLILVGLWCFVLDGASVVMSIIARGVARTAHRSWIHDLASVERLERDVDGGSGEGGGDEAGADV